MQTSRGVLIGMALLAAPSAALADLAPPSPEQLAEWQRIAERAEADRASCNLEKRQGPKDTCFVCDGDVDRAAMRSCQDALARYGFSHICDVHSPNTMPLSVSYSLVCRTEREGVPPLPCSSLPAIESFVVEMRDHAGECSRAKQQAPGEQCVRCSASDEDCQALAAAGFSERCEARFPIGSRRAELWCRPRSATQEVRCETLARLNPHRYPSSAYRQLNKQVEGDTTVPASYAPPARPAEAPSAASPNGSSGSAHCATGSRGGVGSVWLLLIALGGLCRRRG